MIILINCSTKLKIHHSSMRLNKVASLRVVLKRSLRNTAKKSFRWNSWTSFKINSNKFTEERKSNMSNLFIPRWNQTYCMISEMHILIMKLKVNWPTLLQDNFHWKISSLKNKSNRLKKHLEMADFNNNYNRREKVYNDLR